MNPLSVEELKSIIAKLKFDDAELQALESSRSATRDNGMTEELQKAIKDIAGLKAYLAQTPAAQ